jgi:hypothetical protein
MPIAGDDTNELSFAPQTIAATTAVAPGPLVRLGTSPTVVGQGVARLAR